MAIYQSASECIPEGSYLCRCLSTVEFSSDPGNGRARSITLFLQIETAEGTVDKESIQCINKKIPARGAAKKTPFEFMLSACAALGATQEQVFAGIRKGLEGVTAGEIEDGRFEIEGLGSVDATAKVTIKRLDNGYAENIAIWPGAMSASAAKALLDDFGPPGGSAKSPFGAVPARGTPIAPPVFAPKPSPPDAAPPIAKDEIPF